VLLLQWYEQVLQISQLLHQALILPGLALYLPSGSVSLSSWCGVYLIFKKILLHSVPFSKLSLVGSDQSLTWLTSHRPLLLSVEWDAKPYFLPIPVPASFLPIPCGIFVKISYSSPVFMPQNFHIGLAASMPLLQL